jgi:cellulose synthase/poly-beta-1,6-N-acetylglucosamine synthase-like glycosyltransferase/peptidoglycan/xylan/chitin deacetylase (PgdA/CDA1 family)
MTSSPPARRAARTRTPVPRAHWLVLGVGLILVALLVAFDAITHDPGGEAPHAAAASGDLPPVPSAILHGGPVVDSDLASTGGTELAPHTIALTFDDGPSAYTPQVLDVLERFHVPATFFVIGSNIAGRGDILRRIVADGDEIGVHTFTHVDVASEPAWRERMEISSTDLAIAAETGYLTDLLRLPFASQTSAMTPAQWAAVQRAKGYRTVFADLDTEDWSEPGVAAIVRAATPTGSRGALVMMHDGGGDRSQTVAALNQLIPSLLARGYHFVTVSHAIGVASPWTQADFGERMRGTVLMDTATLSRWLVDLLTVLFWIAGGLAVLRTLVLVAFARRHARRPAVVVDELQLPPVSIVVPAYNERAGIEACLRSLLVSRYPEYEVIVVDDGSTDGTADLVHSLHLPRVTVITQVNGGKPSALNTGVAAAHHDVLVLVDGDTVFEPDSLRALVEPLLTDGIGAVSGNTKVANRRGLLGRWQHIEYVVGFNLDRRMYDVLECMPTVPGAIGAFRRDVLGEVGGISSDTLAEDTDLTMAICRTGKRVVYAQGARAWTEAPESLSALWRQRYRWCYGTLQAMWKHRGALTAHGRAGHLGRRGLPYLLMFQVVLPLLTPVLDIAAITGVVTGRAEQLGVAWIVFQLLQLLSAVYAFRLDGERLRTLWALPLQTIVYRQLMYLVVVQSVANAVYGVRLRWHKLDRTGHRDDAPVAV